MHRRFAGALLLGSALTILGCGPDSPSDRSEIQAAHAPPGAETLPSSAPQVVFLRSEIDADRAVWTWMLTGGGATDELSDFTLRLGADATRTPISGSLGSTRTIRIIAERFDDPGGTPHVSLRAETQGEGALASGAVRIEDAEASLAELVEPVVEPRALAPTTRLQLARVDGESWVLQFP